MKKAYCNFFIIPILLACCFLASCSTNTRNTSTEATNEQATGSTSEKRDRADPLKDTVVLDRTQISPYFKPKTSGELDFRYIYRGFTAVPLNNREIIERFMKYGRQIIETEEQWSAFMACYCPGIPYDEAWDLSQDYLLTYITGATSPEYTKANPITSLVWKEDCLLSEYENEPANYVYALNSEEYAHFYVEVIAVSRDGRRREVESDQSATSEGSASKPIFKTVCQVFVMVSFDDQDAFERFSGFGTKVISTEESWYGFVSIFCPGVPWCEPVDFENESVVVSVMMGARPAYIGTSKTVGIDQENGYPVFKDDATNCVYVLNTENYTHFYVDAVSVPNEQVSNSINIWTNE